MAGNLDEINQKVEEQTGFGNYVAKDIKSTGMILGGAAVGVGAGYLASRNKAIVDFTKKIVQWGAERIGKKTVKVVENVKAAKGEAGAVLPTAEEIKEGTKLFSEVVPYDLVLGGAGGVVGLTAAAIPNTYEHWREGKKQQLRVEEMGNDVIALREQRLAAMASLREQAESIRGTNDMIKQIIAHGPQGAKPIVLKGVPEDKVAAVDQSREQAAEAQRG